MTLDEGISRLIGDIYASPVDEQAWKRVLDQLLFRTGSRIVFVSAVDLKSQKYSKTLWHGPDSARVMNGMTEYVSEQFRQDPLLLYAARHPNAGFAESRSAVRALGRSWDDDPYFRFTAGELGIRHNAVCYTTPNEDLTLGVSIHLPATAGGFETEQLSLFRLLFDHLQRAIRLAAYPPDFADPRDARVLLDGRGIVLSANRAAEGILARRDGLLMIDRRLHGARHEGTRRIDALVAKTLATNTVNGGGGATSLDRPSGKPAWILTADCLPQGAAFFSEFQASISLRIIERPLRTPQGVVERIAHLFALTPTEARLLSAVFGGDLDLRDAADHLALTYSTARVHMRRILSKAEVRSQAALARLIQKIER
jgi:DNA-binding CsgD family transcriptional regulator